jgi:hypothetical protein
MEAFTNPLKPNIIYFCNDGGVYEYDENNNSFTDKNNDLLITQFYDISVGQDIYDRVSGGSQDNANIYRTPQGDWIKLIPNADGMYQELDPNNRDIVYTSYQYGVHIKQNKGIYEVYYF